MSGADCGGFTSALREALLARRAWVAAGQSRGQTRSVMSWADVAAIAEESNFGSEVVVLDADGRGGLSCSARALVGAPWPPAGLVDARDLTWALDISGVTPQIVELTVAT
jgi:hypothetical protein